MGRRGSDFSAVVAGGSFGRIHKTHDNARHGEWPWSLTYPAATRLVKQGRAKTKQEAAEAVRAGLDEALRWHAERGQPLLLWRHDAPNHATDWRQRVAVGPCHRPGCAVAEGWAETTKPPRRVPAGLKASRGGMDMS